ncbi:MAG: hypothetical protein U0401_00150 [Anaerolineae bacterium]
MMALCLVFAGAGAYALSKIAGSSSAQTYIEIVRAIPLYVFLLWIYFGLSVALGSSTAGSCVISGAADLRLHRRDLPQRHYGRTVRPNRRRCFGVDL